MNNARQLLIRLFMTGCVMSVFAFFSKSYGQNACIDSSLIDPDAICITLNNPVCGCNGITYGNSCEAITSGVVEWLPGVCPGSSNCDSLNVAFGAYLITHSMTIAFFDQSSMSNGQIVSWIWDFGNGIIVVEQNPSHDFLEPGTYLVCLNVQALDANGNLCQKTFCQEVVVPSDCFDNCFYSVAVDLNGADLHAALTPPVPDTPFWFFVLWSLDDGAATGTGLEFNYLISEPGVHTLCATYPTGDFTAETCTVCKAFEVTTPCVDTAQIDSVACPLIYMPVCGCNGITYNNSCEAYHYGGVTAWSPGVCGSVCNNLSIDFDGFNSGGSLTYWTFNDQSSFPGGHVTSWFWDFGNGQTSNEENPSFNFNIPGDYQVCLFISGVFADGTQCGTNLCKTIHVGGDLCIDPAVIDLNTQCPAIYQPVCGCDGITYENECFAYYHHGVTEWTSGACQDMCINPAWIDTLIPCIEIYDPVCGCNGQTYDNECYAKKNGVTSWDKGVCCPAETCQANFALQLLPNHTVQLTNLSVNAASWALSFGDGANQVGDFDSVYYTYALPGIYQICLEINNFNGTCNDQFCLFVDFSASSVTTLHTPFSISVQPNPGDKFTTIKTPDATILQVILLDIYGTIIAQQSVSSSESVISTVDLPSGIYLLQVMTDKGAISRKIVVQH